MARPQRLERQARLRPHALQAELREYQPKETYKQYLAHTQSQLDLLVEDDKDAGVRRIAEGGRDGATENLGRTAAQKTRERLRE